MVSDRRTYVIAEAGVNHIGSLEMALELVDAAAEAGADAVKFQTFRATELVSDSAPKAAYQLRTTSAAESHLAMIQKLELTELDHEALVAQAGARSIAFLSTPFDRLSLSLLTDRFRLDTIKVSSGDLTNAPLLLGIARSAKRVFLSTGMATLAEVEAALGVLAYGFIDPPSSGPGRHAFERAFASEEGQALLRNRVTLLHCTTEYPAPVADVNLRAMDTLSAAFGLPVGYSDHTAGIHIALAAVARGAVLLEKHFTLDRTLAGPDHAASLEPRELEEMIEAIRDVDLAMGDGLKRPTTAEWATRSVARRSLVAARPLLKGERISEEDLISKRPGDGRSPMELWDIVGRRAIRGYSEGEAFDE